MEINKLQFDKEILSLRSQIDKIDCQILSLLAKRQGQVEEVVKLKKTHH
ncbi:MAG: hypothetical protein HN597_06235, partial [Desulfobacula sp.]|nr:hypothetical protein [Desulfobacula sp.]